MFKLRASKGNIHLVLLYKLLIALILLFISRLFFYLFNIDYYSNINTGELIKILFYGLRFDLSAVLIINLPLIFLNVIPFPFRYKKLYQIIVNVLFFYIVNSIFLMANYADSVYFRYTLKRSMADVFQFLSNEKNEIMLLLPNMISDFWPEFVTSLLSVIILIFLGSRFKVNTNASNLSSITNYLRQTIIFIITGFIVIIGIRGGFQLKPINIVTAGHYTKSKNIPLLLNSTFTIAKTIDQRNIKKISFFPEKELSRIYNPVHEPDKLPDSCFQKKNVIIIIMESFSSEHSALLNPKYYQDENKGYTPFLDSLMKKSIYFNGYANGTRSIEAIPAIVAGIPSLMNRDFLSSFYSGSKINSIASLLKEKAYTTAFYHGGTNGTMSFDVFAKIAGFDNYYGRDEFNDDKYFDGKWGIYDKPFFDFFSKKLDNTPQPFCVVFFSLSSHHPYKIPDKYKNKFKNGKLPIHESIGYADYSLNQFFKKIVNTEWYDNSLFVITADHTSEAYLPEYQTRIGSYKIPIIFYQPGDSATGFINTKAQQTDIMPTILNKLHYNEDYVAFGSDLFNEQDIHFAINYLSGTYQLIQGDYALISEKGNAISLYNIKYDKKLNNNIADQKEYITECMERLTKAIIQQYNNRLIENNLTIDKND